MKSIYMNRALACLLLFGIVGFPSSPLRAQEEDTDDPVVQMIVELLGDEDRDMRALALQQIREEAPGEAATKTFIGILPKLAAQGQAELLEALGDREDPAALGAIVENLKSEGVVVRAAALRALGSLGTTAEVPLLAGKAAAGSDDEKAAARQSLVRLRGDDVNPAIVSAMAEAEPAVRVELLAVLAARNAKGALSTVLSSAQDEEASVRLAALGALRFLADQTQTAEIVKILTAAKDDPERVKAKLALLTVCRHGGEACADAIIPSLADADAASRIILLNALARAGGTKSLETVVASLEDDDQAVRDEAVRILANSLDPAATPKLQELAESSNRRHQVLAIRGLVRMASPRGEEPADLEILAKLLNLAKRPREKQLILGVLGGVPKAEALELVASAVDDPEVAEEAGLAAVRIAQNMEAGDKAKIRAAMQKVIEGAKRQSTRDDANKVLQSL